LEAVKEVFKNNDVIIFNPKKLYDLLMHGFLRMEQIDLLIIDECHHTADEHLYN
jgi:endoribonuclease Dicer